MAYIPKYKNSEEARLEFLKRSNDIFEKLIYYMKYLGLDSVELNTSETSIHEKREFVFYTFIFHSNGEVEQVREKEENIVLCNYKDFKNLGFRIRDGLERTIVKALDEVERLEGEVRKIEELVERANDTSTVLYEEKLLIEKR